METNLTASVTFHINANTLSGLEPSGRRVVAHYDAYNCRPLTYRVASKLLRQNNVKVKHTPAGLKFECLKNYHQVSGDMLRYCTNGKWSGSLPHCEVDRFMDKKSLATFIVGFVSLLTIPYLCVDFYLRFSKMQDRYEYRNYCNYQKSMRNAYNRHANISIFVLQSVVGTKECNPERGFKTDDGASGSVVEEGPFNIRQYFMQLKRTYRSDTTVQFEA